MSPFIPVLVADAKEPHGWRQLNCDVLSVAFSPNGRFLAFGTEDTEHPQIPLERTSLVLVWDLKYRQLLYPSVTAAKGVPSLAFSPDSRILAAACGDGAVLLWNVTSFFQEDPRPRDIQPTIQPKPHAGGDRRCLQPKRHDVAWAGKDGKVGLWHMPQPGGGKITREFIDFGSKVHVTSIGFDPKGMTLAAGGLGQDGQTLRFAGGKTGISIDHRPERSQRCGDQRCLLPRMPTPR